MTIKLKKQRNSRANQTVFKSEVGSQKVQRDFLHSLLTSIAVLFFPLLPLSSLHSAFYGDWANPMWGIAFNSEYLKSHGHFSFFVSSPEYIQYPLMVFYGYLFIPLIGLLGKFLNPDLAVRIFIVGIYFTQFFMVNGLFRKIIDRQIWSLSVSALVTWALYPLTNLYSRGALAEFFATISLTISVLAWLNFLTSSSRLSRILFSMTFAVCLAFSVGTHPITALMIIPVGLIIFLGTIPWALKKGGPSLTEAVLHTFFAALFVLAVNLPWLISTISFVNRIPVGISTGVVSYPDTYDNLRTRLSPIPFDGRSLFDGIHNEAPYMDLQINMPLVFLLVGILILIGFRSVSKSNMRFLFYSSIVIVVFTVWASVEPSAFNLLPAFLSRIQMIYRMITYSNLFILMALVAMAKSNSEFFRKDFSMSSTVLLTVCLTLGFSNSLTKYNRAKALSGPRSAEWTKSLATTKPPEFPIFAWTSTDYPKLNRDKIEMPRELKLTVGSGNQFGEVLPAELDLSSPNWVTTNVVAFNWNRMFIDGTPVLDSELRQENFKFALKVPAGHHVVSVKWIPDDTWKNIVELSIPLFLLAVGMIVSSGLFQLANHLGLFKLAENT